MWNSCCADGLAPYEWTDAVRSFHRRTVINSYEVVVLNMPFTTNSFIQKVFEACANSKIYCKRCCMTWKLCGCTYNRNDYENNNFPNEIKWIMSRTGCTDCSLFYVRETGERLYRQYTMHLNGITHIDHMKAYCEQLRPIHSGCHKEVHNEVMVYGGKWMTSIHQRCERSLWGRRRNEVHHWLVINALQTFAFFYFSSFFFSFFFLLFSGFLSRGLCICISIPMGLFDFSWALIVLLNVDSV